METLKIKSGNTQFTTTTTSLQFGEQWSDLERVSAEEVGETIEFIYTQYSYYNVSPSPPTERRAVKIIFSCIDGKWNKSEPIYGKIFPVQEEWYEFD